MGCADRVYVRLFPWRSGGHSQAHEPDVLVVEAREIASMSIRTVEVFLYGPKPRIVEWLVIEPAQTLADAISGSVRPLLTRMEPDKAVLVDTLNPTGLPQVLDEVVKGSVTRTYAYGLQRVSQNQQISGTWTPSFYGYDGHGNVRFLTNTSGAVGNTYQFDAFGNQDSRHHGSDD